MKDAEFKIIAEYKKKMGKLIALIILLLCVCSISAEAAAASVKVLTVGKSYTITGSYSAKSSRKAVASAKKIKTGKYRITANKKGRATITVYNKNGKASRKIYLLVTDSASFKYSTSKLTLEAGSSKTVKATAQNGCTVKYKSSDSNIAKVSGKGEITAVASGTATISAKFYYKRVCVKTLKKKVTVTEASSDTNAETENQEEYPGYSYGIYLVGPSGQKLYSYPADAMISNSTNTRPIYCFYIKTANTALSSFDLYVNGTLVSQATSSAVSIHTVSWDDINYANSSIVNGYRRVSGGYIINLSFPTAGQYMFEFVEYGTNSKANTKTVSSFTLNVLDYEEEETKWIDNLIAEHTTDSMNSFEKMESVCNYLTSAASGFTYLSNINGDVLTLAGESKGSYFENLKWDSYISPAVLAQIAERIGGFTYIHNCYYDYTKGSEAWKTTHYLLKYGIDGDIREISVCPAVSTGEIGTLTYINFSSTSQMVRVG
ncbi:MAG: Ig-like domain-containing protein [Lachnospiraceae bacterium]|nr:Ig-like domain-containing protein [Lachnospiraceae bacterium]